MNQHPADWYTALGEFRKSDTAAVVVIVVDVEGSAPREVGSRMVVSLDEQFDTIGGGALELEAIDHARQLLHRPDAQPLITTRTLTLGPALSQCCGGRVTLQFDVQPANTLKVNIFGAGHVAQELARLLVRLPCSATFYDDRPEWIQRLPLPQVQASDIGNNPHAAVDACKPGSCYLIMTHSHELDLELVEAVLSRQDSVYCGLIASRSKAASFRSRLRRKGFTGQELSRLTAPIGEHMKTGNTPMEVAIAAMADVLTHYYQWIETHQPSVEVVSAPAR